MYTYEEAIDFDDITNKELFCELNNHDASMIEYFSEMPSKQYYTGEDVLGWLGY